MLAVRLEETFAVQDEPWLAFGTGNNSCYLAAHELAGSLRPEMAHAHPMFHALTSCDAVSVFIGHLKKTVWSTWKSMPTLTKALIILSNTPISIPDESM